MIVKVPFNICALRRQKRAGQKALWDRLGVDQSSGSRYETKNGMPPPIDILFRMAYVMSEKEASAMLADLRKPFPLERDTAENHRMAATLKIIGSMRHASEGNQ